MEEVRQLGVCYLLRDLGGEGEKRDGAVVGEVFRVCFGFFEECGDFGVLRGVWEGCGVEGAVDYGAELGSDDWAGLVEDVVGAGVCGGA
ncbi:hypothetical protein NDU88_000608 [Pleurodeles waltl]|uniref:Uncharacterized protein n=1 Tax=Pleurodeles waltl TaxID=8319 RepID=A0AAV7VU09_PLEWA|nr:hypothetical protein NDU88_000608 [Pleurodeles waltl]